MTQSGRNLNPSLRILFFGAGAIGTYIGGSLALQGHSVMYIERPQIAEILNKRGLRLNIENKEFVVPSVPIVTSLPEALNNNKFDIACIAVKSYDTIRLLSDIQPFSSIMPPILCLQNGVENEEQITKVVGSERVIPASVTTAIGRREVGDIVVERLRGIGIGLVAEQAHLVDRLVNAMQIAGLNASLYPHPADMKWSKLLTNLQANASSAILDMTPAEIFNDSGLYRLEIAQLREALKVMDALGIRVVDLPGTPARALALAARYFPPSISHPLARKALVGSRGAKMPSFYIDLHQNHSQSEVDFLNGAVVRFGERVNIPTPVNHLFNATLLALTKGDISIQSFAHKPEILLAQVKY